MKESVERKEFLEMEKIRLETSMESCKKQIMLLGEGAPNIFSSLNDQGEDIQYLKSVAADGEKNQREYLSALEKKYNEVINELKATN